jgi:hypothetical protein
MCKDAAGKGKGRRGSLLSYGMFAIYRSFMTCFPFALGMTYE